MAVGFFITRLTSRRLAPPNSPEVVLIEYYRCPVPMRITGGCPHPDPINGPKKLFFLNRGPEIKGKDMIDRKAWNSSLRPVSKKKLESSERFGLKRTPLKPMSDKQREKIKTYRQIGFETRGKRCFLCGRTISQTLLCIHHYNKDRNDNRPQNLFPLCQKGFGCGAHSHMGSVGLKELNEKIDKKLKEAKK